LFEDNICSEDFMPNHLFTVILLLYLCAIAAGQEWQDYAQDWLNGDYYGSPYYIDGNTYYSYTPIGFTDPVFSPYGYVNYTYPYFSDDIFTYGLSPYSGYSSPDTDRIYGGRPRTRRLLLRTSLTGHRRLILPGLSRHRSGFTEMASGLLHNPFISFLSSFRSLLSFFRFFFPLLLSGRKLRLKKRASGVGR
jgi:hypothetical protein